MHGLFLEGAKWDPEYEFIRSSDGELQKGRYIDSGKWQSGRDDGERQKGRDDGECQKTSIWQKNAKRQKTG